ncbi:hypothetical protein KC333_g2506 [Hortaea werneckii]|nr:hypothetical protein KC333_g2506 [Hortaea werneckii]KAI7315174.1 hypothetical protein KC326_g4782 [Hortaea werneckii]
MSTVNAGGLGSAGPAGSKDMGGVALPTNPGGGLAASERAAGVHSPFHAFVDPFKGTMAPNSSAKLSAGAQAFKPNGKTAPTPIKILNRDSTADDHPVIVTSPMPTTNGSVDGGSNNGQKAAQQPIGTRNGKVSPSRPLIFFTTDIGENVPFQGGHYVKVDNITKTDLDVTFCYLNEDYDWHSKIRVAKGKFASDGKTFEYYICFDDLRYAGEAFKQVEMLGKDWVIKHVTQTEFASNVDAGNANEKTSFHDGQAILAVNFDGNTAHFDPNKACDAARITAEKAGDLRAFTEIPSRYPALEFRVEYYAISDAKKLIKGATEEGPAIQGKYFIVAKELSDYTTGAVNTDGANDMINGQSGIANMNILDTPHRHIMAGDGHFTSPTGRTAWSVDKNGNVTASAPPRVVNKVGPVTHGVPITEFVATTEAGRGRFLSAPLPPTPSHHLAFGTHVQPRSNSWNGVCFSHQGSQRAPVQSPQAVEVWKIENGQDVRTTVMLRNIPNRMQCQELKDILDRTSHGKYDFSYLRIDFEKGTNVGYAFVNFSDPMHIIDFVVYNEGKPWVLNNPRLVELSYATVQGYDCLVEKFRNSAIMSEYHDYRPKLWYTIESAPEKSKIGTEAPFPAPNNLSKRQRSHDNANYVGLYGPRSSHSVRDRGRHSQYDRGTPAQLHEDAVFHQMSPATPYGSFDYYGTPRMNMAPPSTFTPAGYPNGFGHFPVVPYMGGNHMMPNAYGMIEGPADPFGPQPNHAVYPGQYNMQQHGGYGNGHYSYGNGQTPAFGTGPGTPASRLRTQTNGRLGGKARVSTAGGPVQTPVGSYVNHNKQQNPMPKVMEGDELAAHAAATDEDGYNDTPGPFAYPSRS